MKLQTSLLQHNQEIEKLTQKVLSSSGVGFHQIPHRNPLWTAIENLKNSWVGKFDQVAVVGIGGSSLGPQVISDVFQKDQVLYFENADSVKFKTLCQKIKDPQKTAWVISSKSGATIETLCLIEALTDHFQDMGPLVCVISEKVDNPLTLWAKKKNYPQLEIPLDVGGRYSVLTAVGMLPAALLGLNIREFQKGATAALQDKAHIHQLVAQTIASFEREEWITVFWFYTSSGVSMGRWVQQLWAESLGKKKSKSGEKARRVSTPMIAMGSVDQHSTLQQMMEGFSDQFFWFFRFENLEKNQALKIQNFPHLEILKNKTMGDLFAAQATANEKALNERGAQSLRIVYPDLNEYSLGHFFMIMQLVVAVVAEALDLNAFDQPGVERSKVLTNSVLSQ
jgi:glucose-6-phosphate isomerase